MKTGFTTFVCVAFLLLGACKSRQQKRIERSFCKVEATYFSYNKIRGAAKGKGIVFRVQVSQPDVRKFTIDSFYVNNRPVKFAVRQVEKGTYTLASVYLKDIPDSLNRIYAGAGFSMIENTDAVINDHSFYPSWVVIRYGKKSYSRINIAQYFEVK
jgi:hypothetical protein